MSKRRRLLKTHGDAYTVYAACLVSSAETGSDAGPEGTIAEDFEDSMKSKCLFTFLFLVPCLWFLSSCTQKDSDIRNSRTFNINIYIFSAVNM